MKMFKQRNVQIATGVIAVLLLISGFLLFGNKSKSAPEPVIEDQSVQAISAEELGLTLEAKPDGKAVKFKIAKLDGIKAVEYELVYEADSTAAEIAEGGEPRVQRGITGDTNVNSGENSYESEWLDLGSCSRNVCRYDTGVEEVSLTLKLTKSDNKIYQAEKSLEL
jgi:hypothetical protein